MSCMIIYQFLFLQSPIGSKSYNMATPAVSLHLPETAFCKKRTNQPKHTQKRERETSLLLKLNHLANSPFSDFNYMFQESSIIKIKIL